MIHATRAAFMAYFNRFSTWAQGAVERLAKTKDAAQEAPGYGEPEVTVTDEGIAEILLYAFVESHFICEMCGLPGSMAVSDVGFARAMDKAKATKKPIHVRINSGGGDVFAGVAVANMVREAKALVIVDGNAASIATVIAAASRHVTMLPGTTMMVHNPWSGVAGNSRAMRAEADILDKLRDAMLDIYTGKSKTKQDRQSWQDLLDGADGADGSWLSAAECVAIGIADVAPSPEADTPTAAMIEQRQMVATLHGVALPKNLAELPGQVGPLNPPVPASVEPVGAIAAGVRVCHRPGAFRSNP